MNESTFVTSTVQVDFDGAEGIALWFMNPETEESSKLLFNDMPEFIKYLREWFPGLFEQAHTPTDDEPIAYGIYGRVTGNLKYVQVMDEQEVAEQSEFYDVVPLFRRPVQGEPTDAFPWAVENRVVKGPVVALFRTEEEAEDYADGFLDLRVRPVEEVRDLLR